MTAMHQCFLPESEGELRGGSKDTSRNKETNDRNDALEQGLHHLWWEEEDNGGHNWVTNTMSLHAVAGAVLFEATTATAAQPDIIRDDGSITNSTTSSDSMEYGKKELSEEDNGGHGGTIANDPLRVTSGVSSMEAQGETAALHVGNGTNKKEGRGKGTVIEVA